MANKNALQFLCFEVSGYLVGVPCADLCGIEQGPPSIVFQGLPENVSKLTQWGGRLYPTIKFEFLSRTKIRTFKNFNFPGNTSEFVAFVNTKDGQPFALSLNGRPRILVSTEFKPIKDEEPTIFIGSFKNSEGKTVHVLDLRFFSNLISKEPTKKFRWGIQMLPENLKKKVSSKIVKSLLLNEGTLAPDVKETLEQMVYKIFENEESSRARSIQTVGGILHVLQTSQKTQRDFDRISDLIALCCESRVSNQKIIEVLNEWMRIESVVSEEKANQRFSEYQQAFLLDSDQNFSKIEHFLTFSNNFQEILNARDEIFQVLHTVKGNAQALGFTKIGMLAGKLELFFGSISKLQKSQQDAALNVLRHSFKKILELKSTELQSRSGKFVRERKIEPTEFVTVTFDDGEIWDVPVNICHSLIESKDFFGKRNKLSTWMELNGSFVRVFNFMKDKAPRYFLLIGVAGQPFVRNCSVKC